MFPSGSLRCGMLFLTFSLLVSSEQLFGLDLGFRSFLRAPFGLVALYVGVVLRTVRRNLATNMVQFFIGKAPPLGLGKQVVFTGERCRPKRTLRFPSAFYFRSDELESSNRRGPWGAYRRIKTVGLSRLLATCLFAGRVWSRVFCPFCR